MHFEDVCPKVSLGKSLEVWVGEDFESFDVMRQGSADQSRAIPFSAIDGWVPDHDALLYEIRSEAQMFRTIDGVVVIKIKWRQNFSDGSDFRFVIATRQQASLTSISNLSNVNT